MRTKGWCYMHYARWWRTGEVGDAAPQYVVRGPVCQVEGCGGKHLGLGFCKKHYENQKRYGSPHKPDLLLRRLEKYVGRARRDDCWPWTGNIDALGYGVVSVNGNNRRAHRVAYEAWKEPIPTGMVLDHLCRNTACCNPRHLEPVTQTENVLRGTGFAARNARATHCPQGHPYDEQNTRRYQGRRYCKECSRIRNRERMRAKRAAGRT